MLLERLQDQVVHHSANAAAVAIPVMTVWLKAPLFFSVLTGALGAVWYAILIGEKIATLWQRWRKKAP